MLICPGMAPDVSRNAYVFPITRLFAGLGVVGIGLLVFGLVGTEKHPASEGRQYALDCFLDNETREEEPAPPLELAVYRDSIFIFYAVTGAVEARKNRHAKVIQYQHEKFRIRNSTDSLYWVGDSLTWVWVRTDAE